MKCRLCSQQLRGVGRLCRECQQELERARHAAHAGDELTEVVVGGHGDADANGGWTGKLRAPRNVIALAFCVGAAAAGAFVQHDSSRTGRSVMLDVPPGSAARSEAPPRDAVAMRAAPRVTAVR